MSPTDDPIEAARRDIATKFLKAHLEAFRLRRAFEALPSPASRTRFCLQSHEGFLVDLADSQVDASTSIWTENPAEALQFVTYSKAVGSALLLKEAHPDLLVSSVVFQLEANSHDWVSAK